MSLADELGAVSTFDARACRVYAAMLENPEEADVIFDACTSVRLPAVAVAKVLSRNGIQVSAATVKRHRRNECRCQELMPDRYE